MKVKVGRGAAHAAGGWLRLDVAVVRAVREAIGPGGALATGRRLDARQVRSAPHHYGLHLGNFIAAHLAGAVERFAFVEWDEAATPGVDAPGYGIEEGGVRVPESPGFGIELDEDAFAAAIRTGGFSVDRAQGA